MGGAVLAAALSIALLSPAAGQGVFDWGRPCVLKGSDSAIEVESTCTSCGSGTNATPQPGCTFLPSTIPAGTEVSYKWHASAHNLFVGSSPCAYTTEICPNAPASQVTATNPCKYTFATPGTYYVSDKAGGYCTTFGANKKYIVT